MSVYNDEGLISGTAMQIIIYIMKHGPGKKENIDL